MATKLFPTEKTTEKTTGSGVVPARLPTLSLPVNALIGARHGLADVLGPRTRYNEAWNGEFQSLLRETRPTFRLTPGGGTLV
jgi:hypothetical protein